MAKIMDAEPDMEIYDPCCGSGGLLIKCELVMEEKIALGSKEEYAPLSTARTGVYGWHMGYEQDEHGDT